MKRVTVPNEFWREKAGLVQYNGKEVNMLPKEWATALMLFNATIPLYEAKVQPETIEETTVWCETKMKELSDRVCALEERLLTTTTTL